MLSAHFTHFPRFFYVSMFPQFLHVCLSMLAVFGCNRRSPPCVGIFFLSAAIRPSLEDLLRVSLSLFRNKQNRCLSSYPMTAVSGSAGTGPTFPAWSPRCISVRGRTGELGGEQRGSILVNEPRGTVGAADRQDSANPF